MIKIGNFLFRYRNILFPIAAMAALLPSRPVLSSDLLALVTGGCFVFAGQSVRVVTIGLKYIHRGGRDRAVYAKTLVAEGIFAHCRNPMYVGNILMVIGFCLALNSLLCFALGTVLSLFAYQAIVLAEENFLGSKFGEDYQRYCKEVPRWRIRLRGLVKTVRATSFDWRRVVVKEYGTLFNSLVGLPIALCIRRYLYGWGDPGWTLMLPICGAWAAVAGVCYLTVRHLKKSKRLRAASS